MDSSSHSSILDNSSHSMSRLQQFIKNQWWEVCFDTLLTFEIRLILEINSCLRLSGIEFGKISVKPFPGNVPEFVN